MAMAVAAVYSIFSSGFGRQGAGESVEPRPRAAVALPWPSPNPTVPQAPNPTAPQTHGSTLAVIADDLWLTYLPPGLTRTGGGLTTPGPGTSGIWARFGSGTRYVEAQVQQGRAAADWPTFRGGVQLTDPRQITVRGRPAVVGDHPNGGKLIAWLEKTGTGVQLRVSDPLIRELIPIAASVKAPVAR